MIIFVIGLPNSGKTTYAKNFECVVHVDDYMVAPAKNIIPNIIKDINLYLTNNDVVLVEGVLFSATMRKRILDGIDKYVYKQCIYLNVDMPECVSRENRGREISMIKEIAKIFQPPKYDEGWNKIVIVNN